MDRKELIEALEKAAGGNRLLDFQIRRTARHLEPEVDMCWMYHNRVLWKDGTYTDESDTPHYSTSIDAALTLVPEGWGRKAEFGPGYANSVIVGHVGADGLYDKPEHWASHKNEAIALCIAALRAREEQ